MSVGNGIRAKEFIERIDNKGQIIKQFWERQANVEEIFKTEIKFSLMWLFS